MSLCRGLRFVQTRGRLVSSVPRAARLNCAVPLLSAVHALPSRLVPSPSLNNTAARRRPFSTVSPSASVVPQIDIQALIRGPDHKKREVAKQIGRACEDIGFLTITNHGVDEALVDRMYQITRQYFDLALPKKCPPGLRMTDDYPYGYSGYLEESLASGHGDSKALKDLKECFCIGPYNPAAGMAAIRWPQEPAHFTEVWQQYYVAMENLASDMLRGFALALDMPENWFADKTTKHRSALRALNYPQQTSLPTDSAQQRAGAHTDYGTLTILLQDSVGGLQVLGKDKQWKDVPYVRNSFVINIGDLMARWTNDKWVSTLHRVKPLLPRRQSIAFFQNINADYLVECIPTCLPPGASPKYPPIKAWDHLIEKHTKSVKY